MIKAANKAASRFSLVRSGFTLVEVLIVVVLMAVLAGAIIPQFADTTTDARTNVTIFNLQSMRSQIETYRAQHAGIAPADLDVLTQKSDRNGKVDPSGAYGPYIQTVPEETITGSPKVRVISGNSPITNGDADGNGGWLYNNTTGELRVNEAKLLAL